MAFYGTVAEADAYHAERGNAGWTGGEATKEIAMRRGSAYIDQAYRSQFPGWPTDDRDQELEWPRNWASDIYGNSIAADEVPIEVKRASFEAALRELVEPGALQPDWSPSAQLKREKADVIEVENMAPYGPQSVLPVVNVIRGIIAPVLTGGVGSSVSGSTARV